jgi:hypothetical protein
MNQKSFIGGVNVLSTYRKQACASAGFFSVAASLVLMPTAAMAVVSGDRVFCYTNRPCIELLTSDTNSIQVAWRGADYYDFYNVRWARPGKEELETHKMLGGGRQGSFGLTKILPNTEYVIKVQGCNSRVWGGPQCTEWETQTVTTQNFTPPEESTQAQPTDTQQPTGASSNSNPSTSKQPNNAPAVVVPTSEVSPSNKPAGTKPN